MGDISKYLDAKAKSQARGMEMARRSIDASFRKSNSSCREVAGLMGKESYEFGDISREIARPGSVSSRQTLLLLLGGPRRPTSTRRSRCRV